MILRKRFQVAFGSVSLLSTMALGISLPGRDLTSRINKIELESLLIPSGALWSPVFLLPPNDAVCDPVGIDPFGSSEGTIGSECGTLPKLPICHEGDCTPSTEFERP